ncbi:MAG: hypothetical protein U0271_25870 [Polyangiaceae bacterium]
MTIQRPRLADHALLRHHTVGDRQLFVVHDSRDGSLVRLDPHAAAVARLADGTRDLDGLALACSRAGIYRRMSELEGIVLALEQAGLLADGVEAGPPPLRSDGFYAFQVSTDAERARPIEELEGYRFSCSGGGACCAQYGTIALDREDVARFVNAGGDPAKLTPLAGGVRTERVALPIVDGHCAELTNDGRCRVHATGGLDAKPQGCRIYPALFVDDGAAIRTSAVVECDCVLASDGLGERDGDPLAGGAREAGALPAGAVVRVLPATIALTAEHTASRGELRAWSAAVDAALRGAAADAAVDGIAAAVALSHAVEAHGLSPEASVAALAPVELATIATALGPVVGRISTEMRAAAAAADAWRSPNDRLRRVRHATQRAASSLAARGAEATLALPLPDPRWSSAERLSLRMAVFGYQLVGDRPLAAELLELAARLAVARELASSGDRSLGHPITVVTAALRN